jgi:tyrosine-protein kinase Etk/Wzc
MKDEKDLFTSNLDYKKIFQRLYSFRRLFITLFTIFIIVTFLINRFSTVKYKNSTSLYLSEEDKSSALNSANDLFQSFGMFNTKENIYNELEILKSFSLIKKVINETDLKVSYFTYKNSPLSDLLFKTPFIKKYELYNQSPIEIILDPSVPQATNLNFRIAFLNENEFLIEADGEEIPLYNYIDDQVVAYTPSIHFRQRFKFGDEIRTRYFNFRVQKTTYFEKDFTTDANLYFILNNINDLTLLYQDALNTETTSERSTLIRISLSGTNQHRITDFLNNLTSAYLGKSLDKKNKTALSTIDFIDSQISDIADSLSYAESALKNFRSSQGVMDLSFQGQQVFEQLNRLENEKAALDVQKKYYEYLSNYLATNTELSDILAPSSMNVVDPILANLVTQLIALNSERVSLLRNSTSQQNLYLADINIRIENLKKTIRETVKNTLNTLNISLNEINYRMSKASGQISQMPKTELQLRGIERKFTLNDAIYTFLMQKRSEAQIARASSLPDYEVVDPAVLAMSRVVSPKSILNYFIAIFLAFLFPTSYIMLKDFLNNKISEPEELEKMSNFPILGNIFHNYHRSKQIVNDHPNSSVTESFRAVRTNFQFFSEGGKRQVLLITSSASGEGKTFCSINLGSVFALNGHRTILLEFDLRRPKIHQEFNSSNIIGISSFLIDKANIEDIIVPTHIENLDLISAGPAAPNPAELIDSERTGELIDKLKEMYDYIIIDSAPAGILTETQLLMKHTDLNIFVVRMEKTIKEACKHVLSSFENNKLCNVSILINDLNVRRKSYKYGYDNKYYTDDKSANFLYRIFHRSRQAS